MPSRAPRGSRRCCRALLSNAISTSPRMMTNPADRGLAATRPAPARGGESGRGLHGWLVIDKPEGITSARAVALIRRATGAKTGHAGTLDPLATGILPLALGEATKTVRFAAAGHKRYRFRNRWGVARETDDREGAITAESPIRPDIAAIEAALPRFTGILHQRPPADPATQITGPPPHAPRP